MLDDIEWVVCQDDVVIRLGGVHYDPFRLGRRAERRPRIVRINEPKPFLADVVSEFL
jgi:hypothetical protein